MSQIRIVTYVPLVDCGIHLRYQFDTLLSEASVEHFLGEFVYERTTDNAVLFVVDGIAVGFNMPRIEFGALRVGPIYVNKSHRGTGIVSQYLRDNFNERYSVAYTDVNNVKSKMAFIAGGFVETGSVLTGQDGNSYHRVTKQPEVQRPVAR